MRWTKAGKAEGGLPRGWAEAPSAERCTPRGRGRRDRLRRQRRRRADQEVKRAMRGGRTRIRMRQMSAGSGGGGVSAVCALWLVKKRGGLKERRIAQRQPDQSRETHRGHVDGSRGPERGLSHGLLKRLDWRTGGCWRVGSDLCLEQSGRVGEGGRAVEDSDGTRV